MLRRKSVLWTAATVFLAAEMMLGVLLQVIGGRAAATCSYACVVLACLFCLLFIERSRSYLLTQLALICTVCADYFLVLALEREQLPAMLFFSVTQLAYFVRIFLADQNPVRRRIHIGVRAGLSVAALLATALVLRRRTDAVALVSMFYYANLICNLVFAFAEIKRHLLLSVGLLLFLACDTVVGLSFLGDYVAIAEDSILYVIIHPGFDLAWAFYVPSQALLALSLLPERLKRSA